MAKQLCRTSFHGMRIDSRARIHVGIPAQLISVSPFTVPPHVRHVDLDVAC